MRSVTQDSDGVWTHLSETVLSGYVWNTFRLAMGVGFLTTIIGVGTAWLVTMHSFPGSRGLRWALILPMAIPVYLSAYALTDLLQFSGPVQTWLRNTMQWTHEDYWFPEMRSLPGATVILSLGLYPYVYLAARTGFATQSASVLEAARTLGVGPWGRFFRIALPLARPTIMAGVALVLMETLAEFGAVDYCAVDTFSTGIYRTWVTRGSLVAASQLSVCLLAAVMMLILLETSSRRAARFHHATQRTQRPVATRLPWLWGIAAACSCSIPVLAGFVVPVGQFSWLTLRSGDQRTHELFFELAANSLLLAATASVLTLSCGMILAFARRMTDSPWMAGAIRVAGFGYAVPGGVIAIGILSPLWWLEDQLLTISESQLDWTPGLFLSGSAVAVICGYLVRFMAVPLNVIAAGYERIRPSIDDAARTLGTSGSGLLGRVHLPLLRSSLAAAGLLVFVDVLKELPATLILRPFDFDTLAVRVYQLAADERLSEASTGALAIIAAGILPVVLLTRILDQTSQPANR